VGIQPQLSCPTTTRLVRHRVVALTATHHHPTRPQLQQRSRYQSCLYRPRRPGLPTFCNCGRCTQPCWNGTSGHRRGRVRHQIIVRLHTRLNRLGWTRQKQFVTKRAAYNAILAGVCLSLLGSSSGAGIGGGCRCQFSCRGLQKPHRLEYLLSTQTWAAMQVSAWV
jgi:hypothetical protein